MESMYRYSTILLALALANPFANDTTRDICTPSEQGSKRSEWMILVAA